VSAAPVVRTTGGLVQGRERRGALFFGGIPYAAAPVGRRRFRPTAPAEPWTGVRDAARPGPAAPQLPGTGLTNSLPVHWDEDCLTVNVVTPATDDRRRPVFVWIHGGNYRHGQGAVPWYDGAAFATAGIVTVTVNYRLGALGFADLGALDPDLAGSGVAGTLDQIAALGWVRDNIAAFGGDPGLVTVGGESAGAFSVASLLASPAAAGLFHRAVLQSGAGHHVHDRDGSAEVARRFLERLGVASPAGAAEATVTDVLDAQVAVEAEVGDGFARTELRLPCGAFYPTVDPAAIPVRPVDAIAAGAGSAVPVLIGTNADETTLFGMGQARDLRRVRHILGNELDDPDRVLEVYRRARPGATPAELLVAVTSDHLFRIPAVRLAEARAATGAAPTWMYRFSWRSRAFDGALGATHALEIPFVFDTLDAPGVSMFLGEGPTPDGLAAVMHASWVAFIRDGEPEPAPGLTWPAYGPADRPVLDFGEPCRLLHDPDREERLVWEGLR
jgi:para-nitrobenzyl esterase